MREHRRLDRLFEASLYVLVLIPFLMIASGGAVGSVLGGLFALSLPVSWWTQRHKLIGDRFGNLWNVIVVGFVAVSAFQLVTTEMTLLAAAIRFVIVLTAIKLFSRNSERDELQIFALSFLGVAAATTVNEDVTFGVLFSLYVLAGTFSLAVFHLRSELGARPRLALRSNQPTLTAGYLGVLVAIAVLILSASVAIFFVFPRLGLGFFAQQSRDGVSMAGFNSEVELGGHGTIRDNPEVVMRVEFLDGPPEQTSSLHWRTISFDHYDGRRWSRSIKMREPSLPVRDGLARLEILHGEVEPGPRLQVYLEPLGRKLLPVLRPSHALRLGSTDYVLRWGPRSGQILWDFYDDLSHTVESDVGLSYVITTATGAPSGPGARTYVGDEFLQLHEMTPRVRGLAADITRGASTNTAKAEAVRQYLTSTYAYTTDLPEVGAKPLDAFLFETRRGHCEYFATATVMLLRANGVHARLVNGFLGGQWNDVGGYLAVRQGDAHSWAEYWDPQRGWIEIDSTPASDAPESAALLEAARATLDAMRLAWMKWVIEYDLNAQIQVFRDLFDVVRPSDSAPRELENEHGSDDDDTGNWRKALFIAGLATLVFAGFRRTRRRLRRHDPPTLTSLTAIFYVSAGGAWSAWFLSFEWTSFAVGAATVGASVAAALWVHTRGTTADPAAAFDIVAAAGRARGLIRAPHEGPAAYLERLERMASEEQYHIRQFRDRYLACRFGSDSLDPEELTRLRASAHRVAERIRRANLT